MRVAVLVFLILISLAAGEIIDLSDNEEVLDWPSFSSSEGSIEIDMCWGEFILERTEDSKVKVIVETNIWSALNENGGVIREFVSDLEFDFTKAADLEIKLDSNEDVYLRVTMSVPTNITIDRIWTTGLFDFYRDFSFPEDYNFGSFEDSIGKTTDPPVELKTISASRYPEGECDDNYHPISGTVIPVGAAAAGAMIFAMIVRAYLTKNASSRVDRSAGIAVTAGVVSTQSQQQSMPQSYTIGEDLPVAQPVHSEDMKSSSKYDDQEVFGVSGFR